MFLRLPGLILLCTAVAAGAQTAHFPSIGAGDVNLPVASIRQARLAGTLLQQYDFSCGSAAIATLLTHHYGTPTDELTVFERMYAHGDQAQIQREGFSLLDMKRFLDTLGFEADGFEQPLQSLREARIPAIVLINQNGYQHFVVIKGLQEDRVLLGDPSQGTRAMPLAAFEALWQSRLLFVIHNRTEQARFNLASDWRVAPRAPLASSMARAGLGALTLPKLGPGDF
jgi:predicted double-glycine peptidase